MASGYKTFTFDVYYIPVFIYSNIYISQALASLITFDILKNIFQSVCTDFSVISEYENVFNITYYYDIIYY